MLAPMPSPPWPAARACRQTSAMVASAGTGVTAVTALQLVGKAAWGAAAAAVIPTALLAVAAAAVGWGVGLGLQLHRWQPARQLTAAQVTHLGPVPAGLRRQGRDWEVGCMMQPRKRGVQAVAGGTGLFRGSSRQLQCTSGDPSKLPRHAVIGCCRVQHMAAAWVCTGQRVQEQHRGLAACWQQQQHPASSGALRSTIGFLELVPLLVVLRVCGVHCAAAAQQCRQAGRQAVGLPATTMAQHICCRLAVLTGLFGCCRQHCRSAGRRWCSSRC